jgi:poly(3-hydroxybutyrate) depolymerase
VSFAGRRAVWTLQSAHKARGFSLILVNALVVPNAARWDVIVGATSLSNLERQSPLYAGGNQPARRGFGITEVTAGDRRLPVQARDIAKTPFYRLVEFTAPGQPPKKDLLAVAPLSGHFAILMRDLVAGLLPYFRVYVTDWVNVRHVPARCGPFGLEKNIASVLTMMKRLRPGLNVIGLCQGGVPALAATALLSQSGDAGIPESLVLIGSPIDPLASPTPVVKLLRSRPLSWFEENLIARVPDRFEGRGRRVYPAHQRLLPLWAYLTRHVSEGSDTARKVLLDDGADPGRFPFLDLFTSIMDLDAAYFLENTRRIFHESLFRTGALYFEGRPVDLKAIRTAALLTVEGERDDIAAPGQTSAAHDLCTSLPKGLHRRLVVPGAGHFSLFYGNKWRASVLPAIREFCGIQERPRLPSCRSLVPVH